MSEELQKKQNRTIKEIVYPTKIYSAFLLPGLEELEWRERERWRGGEGKGEGMWRDVKWSSEGKGVIEKKV